MYTILYTYVNTLYQFIEIHKCYYFQTYTSGLKKNSFFILFYYNRNHIYLGIPTYNRTSSALEYIQCLSYP